MKKLFALILLSNIYLLSQVNISVGSPPADITFSSFDGTGFTTSPSAGQLNSNEWRVKGMSDGDGSFGGSFTSGDLARGSSSGGVTTGGIYAFDVGSGNIALGVQPGTDDMTPGNFSLELINTGTEIITDISLTYKIYVRNDQGRSNYFNFAYSEDDVTYTDISSADYTSPEAADASPGWLSVNRGVNISGLNIAQNDFLFLQWKMDDVSGSGSRDEFALDDISFTSITPVELSSFSAIVILNEVNLKWETKTEVNNYGFEILRSAQSDKDVWTTLGFVNGHGNSNSPKLYSFVDKTVTNGRYSYRLKQIDNDGQYEFSNEVEVDLNSPEKYSLAQNYPNPFNASTKIDFSLAKDVNVSLTVNNLLGQEVAKLVNNEFMTAGHYSYKFDAASLSTGIYIYKLNAGDFVQIKKMTLIK